MGTSSTTTHIYQKKLIVGYRQPQNLREFLVRGAIPLRAGNEKCNPNQITLKMTEQATTNQEPKTLGIKQLQIDQFLTKDSENPMEILPRTPLPSHVKLKPTGISAKECFNFYITHSANTAQIINKPGQIICYTTIMVYTLLCTTSVGEVQM